jgi:hypothetical protein
VRDCDFISEFADAWGHREDEICLNFISQSFLHFFYILIETAKEQATGSKIYFTNPNSVVKTTGFGFFVFGRLR